MNFTVKIQKEEFWIGMKSQNEYHKLAFGDLEPFFIIYLYVGFFGLSCTTSIR